MRFSDDEHSPGIGLGAPLDDPSDFSRRRFAARLRTERPMGDQDDTSYRKEKAMLAIHQAAEGDFGWFEFPECEIFTYNAFPNLPACLAIIRRYKKRFPARWLDASNLNSRYLGRPS
jgi:hypothetical protein